MGEHRPLLQRHQTPAAGRFSKFICVLEDFPFIKQNYQRWSPFRPSWATETMNVADMGVSDPCFQSIRPHLQADIEIF